MIFTNAPPASSNDFLSNMRAIHRPVKKNVSFNESVDEDNNDDYGYLNGSTTSLNSSNGNNKKSILKSRSYTNVSNEMSHSPTRSRSFGGSTQDLSPSGDSSPLNNNGFLVSANTSKKSKPEGYEILTIRAKLKQRVGSNRAQQVTLTDIDSIMRNVVTIIQNEFMKRFPSTSTTAKHAAITAN